MTKKIADSKLTLQSCNSENFHGDSPNRHRKKKGSACTHMSEFKERRLNNGFVVREMKPKNIYTSKGPQNVELRR